MLKDRVAIPLHDHDGKLLGYAGRVVDDSTIKENNPFRYRFPGERDRDGKTYEFRKTLFLYNGFRIKALVDDLIIVEGFRRCFGGCFRTTSQTPWRPWGRSCSERQAELIVSLVKPGGIIWVMPDGDKARRTARTNLAYAHLSTPAPCDG